MKINWLAFLGDFASFWVTLALILLFRFEEAEFMSNLDGHFIPFLIMYLAWALIFFLFGLYDLFKIKPTIPHLKIYGMAIIALFISGTIFFYFIPIFGITPKTNLIYQIIGFSIFSFSFRRILYSVYSSQITKNLLLVGDKSSFDELESAIKENPQIGLRIKGFLPEIKNIEKSNLELKNLVLIVSQNAENISEDDFAYLYKNKVEIINITSAYEKYLLKIPLNHVNKNWILENIKVEKNIIVAKFSRILDIILALVLTIITSPFLLIASIAIYLSDGGKVFYTQERVGVNGKIFKFYKLRSMIQNAENKEALWATKNDPRITPIGKILRKTHLDEVPQMINILKGDMAFVGPRPERPDFVKILDQKIPNYKLRHIILPGFTGWAQIKYRYARTENDSREKFAYDLYYIKNRNIFMDMGIIIRTIQIIFTH